MSQRLLHVQISVPVYFLCPISLELMLDPVTLSSGQTFDRSSIEKWLDDGHTSCPVTRQSLAVDEEPIPNHALRRMIQSWCAENRSLGIERILTPRQPASLTEIRQLIHGLGERKADYMDTLQRLSRIAQDRPRTRSQMLQAGLLSELATFLSQSLNSNSSGACSARYDCFTPRMTDKAGETLRLLALLSEMEGASTCWEPTREQIFAIAQFVVKGKADCRQNAALILSGKQLSPEMKKKVGGMEGFMTAVQGLISEVLVPKASTTGLMLLIQMCTSTRNRVLATEAGVVGALLGVLAWEADKTRTELALKGLEALCGCAEGRAAMLEDGRGIREVVKVINSVSERATRHAIEVLWVVVKKEPGTQARRSALQEGAFEKVMTIAQTAASRHTRSQSSRLLKSLSEVLYSLPNSSSILHHFRLPS